MRARAVRASSFTTTSRSFSTSTTRSASISSLRPKISCMAAGATCRRARRPPRASRSSPIMRAPIDARMLASGASPGKTSCRRWCAGPSRTTGPSSTRTKTGCSLFVRMRAFRASPTGTASPVVSTLATARWAMPSRRSWRWRSAGRSCSRPMQSPEPNETNCRRSCGVAPGRTSSRRHRRAGEKASVLSDCVSDVMMEPHPRLKSHFPPSLLSTLFLAARVMIANFHASGWPPLFL
mmetsp:Transcript_27166/g.74156  ORF Transcript_27166/g.74156 Transcript_27166/m.74156 type:complete len:237 (-) Transcript_27166:314-1024(-)